MADMNAIRRSESAAYETNVREIEKNVRTYILIEFCSNKMMYLDQIIFPEIPLNDYPH
jgi:hypothetical protein